MSRIWDASGGDYLETSGSPSNLEIITAFGPYSMAVMGNMSNTNSEITPVSKYNGNGPLMRITNKKVRFFCINSGAAGVEAIGATDTTPGTWQLYGGAWNGSSTTRVTLDGVQDGTASMTQQGLGAAADWRIGERVAGTFPYDGKIYYVAIWNVYLTDQEWLDLAAGVSPAAIQSGSLQGFWVMDAYPSYTFERDLSSTENAMTPTGTMARSTDEPVHVFGNPADVTADTFTTVADFLRGTVFTLAEPGTITRIDSYCKSTGSPHVFRLGIWKLGISGPTDLLALTPEITVTSTSYAVAGSALSVPVGLPPGDYVIGVWSKDANGNHGGHNSVGVEWDGTATYAAVTTTAVDPWASVDGPYSRKYGFFATYTRGGLAGQQNIDPAKSGQQNSADLQTITKGTGDLNDPFNFSRLPGHGAFIYTDGVNPPNAYYPLQNSKADYMGGSPLTGSVQLAGLSGPLLTYAIRLNSSLSIPTVFTGIDDFSVLFWIYLAAAPASAVDVFHAGSTDNFWKVAIDSNRKVRAGIENVGNLGVSTTALSLSTWHQVGVSRIAGNWKYHIDDVADASTPGSTAPDAPAGNMTFGMISGGTSVDVAHLSIYNVNVSDTQVADHFNYVNRVDEFTDVP